MSQLVLQSDAEQEMDSTTAGNSTQSGHFIQQQRGHLEVGGDTRHYTQDFIYQLTNTYLFEANQTQNLS